MGGQRLIRAHQDHGGGPGAACQNIATRATPDREASSSPPSPLQHRSCQAPPNSHRWDPTAPTTTTAHLIWPPQARRAEAPATRSPRRSPGSTRSPNIQVTVRHPRRCWPPTADPTPRAHPGSGGPAALHRPPSRGHPRRAGTADLRTQQRPVRQRAAQRRHQSAHACRRPRLRQQRPAGGQTQRMDYLGPALLWAGAERNDRHQRPHRRRQRARYRPGPSPPLRTPSAGTTALATRGPG